MTNLPLIVDLDGTFVNTDTTFELCVNHIKRAPIFGVPQLFYWFLKDKAAAKVKLATLYPDLINAPDLPYTGLKDTELFQSAAYKELISGSENRIVQSVSDYNSHFEYARGTTENLNLIGQNKADFLINKFPDGFTYIGDSAADIPVWKAANEAYGFNVPTKTQSKIKNAGLDVNILSSKPKSWKAGLKGMRIHQWSKNSLLAVIPGLNLASAQVSWIPQLLIAFIAFGLVASATYLINDLLDIPSDRAHPTKRNRPFASGALPIPSGIKLILGLIALGSLLALYLGPTFSFMLGGYVIISLAYSIWLKKIMILDCIVLSLLFCWRILTGGVLFELVPNTWFMLAIGFFFFALAIGKRVIEINSKQGRGKSQDTAPVLGIQKVEGRGYQLGDRTMIEMIGVASGFISIVIVMIYALISTGGVIKHETSAALIVVLLTFWVSRFWLLVGRGQVNDDPIIFALKDRISALVLVLLGLIILTEQIWV